MINWAMIMHLNPKPIIQVLFLGVGGLGPFSRGGRGPPPQAMHRFRPPSLFKGKGASVQKFLQIDCNKMLVIISIMV